MYKSGDTVMWAGKPWKILTEYDDEFVYLDVGNNGAQLVSVSELSQVTTPAAPLRAALGVEI